MEKTKVYLEAVLEDDKGKQMQILCVGKKGLYMVTKIIDGIPEFSKNLTYGEMLEFIEDFKCGIIKFPRAEYFH